MVRRKTTGYGQKYDFARKPKRVSIFDDKQILAKPCGWRMSDSGRKYFENRKNRSDKNKRTRY